MRPGRLKKSLQELKIAEHNGVTHGKYILCKAFEKFLSAKVIWRPKDPIETGSGSTELSKIFKVTSEEFDKLSKIVRLDSQEQAYYFKIYRETVGTIPKPKDNEKTCPRCGGEFQRIKITVRYAAHIP